MEWQPWAGFAIATIVGLNPKIAIDGRQLQIPLHLPDDCQIKIRCFRLLGNTKPA
jgi:hypothetical protein